MGDPTDPRLCDSSIWANVGGARHDREEDPMNHRYTRDELVERLVRAGELEVSGEDQEEVDSYFDTEKFQFHGPDGFDADYAGLTDYFRSVRAAFEDRSIRRGIVIAEGDYM